MIIRHYNTKNHIKNRISFEQKIHRMYTSKQEDFIKTNKFVDSIVFDEVADLDPEIYQIPPATIRRQDSLDKKINSLQDLRTSLFCPVQNETIFLEPLDLNHGKSRTGPATPIVLSQ